MTYWKLKKFLTAHRLRPGQLTRATEGKLSRAGVYGLLTDERPQSVHFATLDVLLPALRKLTDEEVKMTDLIEYVDETTAATSKNQAWRRLEGALNKLSGADEVE